MSTEKGFSSVGTLDDYIVKIVEQILVGEVVGE